MKKALLSLSGFFIFFQSFSQLSLDPNEIFARCPNEFIVYTITNAANPLPVCTYEWTVINGEILGGFQDGSTSTFTGGNQVQIKWFNTTSSGSIQVNATNCNPSSGNGTKSVNIPILSINGVNPGAITGDDNVTVNVTANKVYSISQINFPNIGSGDVNPKQVNGYEWEIPAGWTVVSGGNTKSITVKPDNCSGGTIRVRGKNTLCSAGSFYTNWSTVKTITRALGTPGTITGPDAVNCTDITPVTYQINAVTGATSYTWTYPNNWSGTSTTTSITLTPNGLNGGTVTVKANGCSIQSSASSLTISLRLFDPTNPPQISEPSLICSTGQYTVLNQPPSSSVTWSSSDPSTLNINTTTGVAIRQSNFYGPVTVTATVNSPCGVVNVPRSVWVGEPNKPTIAGNPCSGSNDAPCSIQLSPSNNYFTFSLTSDFGTYIPVETDWQWEKISGNFYLWDNGQYNSNTHSGQTDYIYITGANPTENPMQFRCRVHNTCGWSGWRTFIWNDGTTSPPPPPPANYYVVYPNPTGGYVANIALLDPSIVPTTTSPITISLYSIYGQLLNTAQMYSNSSGAIYVYPFPYNTMYVTITFDDHFESHTVYKY